MNSPLPMQLIRPRRRSADVHQQGAGRPDGSAVDPFNRALRPDNRDRRPGVHQELTAPSPDDPFSPLNGLWDPNRIQGRWLYLQRIEFTDTTKAQVAGRIEHVNLNGTTPSVIPELFDLAVDPGAIGAATPRTLNFTPKSTSVGLIQNLPGNLVASLTGQYVERAPKPAELFSRGGHDATLPMTSAIRISASRPRNPSRPDYGGRRGRCGSNYRFYTRFNGFIYRHLTGNTCEDGACAAGTGFRELNQAIYSQPMPFSAAANSSSSRHLAILERHLGHRRSVRCRSRDLQGWHQRSADSAARVGGGVFWRDANWLTRIN